MTALPAWIDKEAWQGFCDMRKAIKKPMTPRAETLVLKELYLLRSRGHDPNACLDQSTLKNWLDVFPVKDKDVPNLTKTETFQREPERSPEQRAADIAARDAFMAKLSHLKIVRTA